MAVTLLCLSGCKRFPDFPGWNPYPVIPSMNKKFKCKLVDQKNMVLECEKVSSSIDNTIDGYFCTSPEQQVAILNWARDVRKIIEKNCQ
jgi:hypothetical protein